jgi:hypothetical protein
MTLTARAYLDAYSTPSRFGTIKQFMTSLQEFKCEICGRVTDSPTHWFVIQCSDRELTVLKWNLEAANAAGARHFCGEAHAQVYISRWFESVCSPPVRLHRAP